MWDYVFKICIYGLFYTRLEFRSYSEVGTLEVSNVYHDKTG